MRTSLFLLLLIALVLLVVGCERQELSIIAVETTPLACATTLSSSESMVCEGMMVLIQIDDPGSIETFQVAVQGPSEQYRWEHMVPVSTSDHRTVLAVPALLLPPEIPFPEGPWKVEVFSRDGSRIEETIPIKRSSSSWDEALLTLASLDPLQWVLQENTWELTGLAPMWTYRLFSSAGNPIYTIEDPHAIEIASGTLREQAYSIIGLYYDQNTDMYLMMRQQLTEFDLPTETAEIE
jgi:hypothetical protein